MEIDKMISRIKWMLDDLEKAKKAGITNAEITALFKPEQATKKYICNAPGYWYSRSLPLHFDYSIDITENKGTISMKVHEYIN